jgi:serine/threonine protein kinase
VFEKRKYNKNEIEIRLIDFGFGIDTTKLKENQLNGHSIFNGTPYYMAPEVVN